jgi:diamine N-acetyltransferase
VITGRRIRFRRPELEGPDHSMVVEWRNDPEIKKYFYEEEPLSLDSHLHWYAGVSRDPSQRYYMVDALMAPDRSDTVLDPPVRIGTIGLSHIDWRSRTAEYGRLLVGPVEYRGGGYGREMEYLLLDYAFNHLNLHKIWSEVLAGNEAPLRLHRWTGFTEEVVLREQVFKDGRHQDVVRIGIFAEDFAARRDDMREALGLA